MMDQSQAMAARRIPLETPPGALFKAKVAQQQQDIRELVGRNLKKARSEAGLSLRQMQTRSDVSANYLSELERGLRAPTLDVLVQLAVALSTSVVALITE